jgi:hypothetical protein
MLHQSDRNFIIIEVEAEAENAVFEFLKEDVENIYIKPTEKEIEQYILSNKESIIVKKLVTQSPTNQINKVKIPALEKILVDLFVDKILFVIYQGRELINIFEYIYKNYELNFSTLLRYAGRRKTEKNIKEFLTKTIKIQNKML